MKKECKMHRKAETETEKQKQKAWNLWCCSKFHFPLNVSKCFQFLILPKTVEQHNKEKNKMKKDIEQNTQHDKLP